MKLPKLDYARPASLAEALTLLRQSAGTARAIAGGQTLMPILAFRLASPALLVDLANIPGLNSIRIDAEFLHLGAMARWADLETHPELKRAHPLLAEALTHIAHWPIRQRGTVGGSLAHADPAAELPGIAVCCDAVIACERPDGTRQVPAAQFFRGALTTVLAADELITALRLPAFPASRRWAFLEFARRRGDFALAGVAVFWDPDPSGAIAAPHVAVIGAHSRPARIAAAEQALAGRKPAAAVFAEACTAFTAALDPPDDLHGTAEYRRALAGTLLHRALIAATERI